MLIPNHLTAEPEAIDPRSEWLTPSEQLLFLFERIGVRPQAQLSVLQDSIDADALDSATEASDATISFELWGHWVRITPEVIEVYKLAAPPDVERRETV